MQSAIAMYTRTVVSCLAVFAVAGCEVGLDNIDNTISESEIPEELTGTWVAVSQSSSVIAVSCYELGSDGSASLWLALDGLPARELFDDGTWSYASGTLDISVNGGTESYQASLELDPSGSSFALTDSSGRVTEFESRGEACALASATTGSEPDAGVPDAGASPTDPTPTCLWDAELQSCVYRATCDGCVSGGFQPTTLIAPDDPARDTTHISVFGEYGTTSPARLVLRTSGQLCGSYSLSALPVTETGERTVSVPTSCTGDLIVELADATSADQYGYVTLQRSATTATGGTPDAGPANPGPPDAGTSAPSTPPDASPPASCASNPCDCAGVTCGTLNACGARCVCGDFYGEIVVMDGSDTTCWVGDITVRPGDWFAAVMGNLQGSP